MENKDIVLNFVAFFVRSVDFACRVETFRKA
jgi:hypothetical protein